MEQHDRAYYDELMRKYDVKPDVLSAEQIQQMVPFLAKRPKLTRRLMHLFRLDMVNQYHEMSHRTPGPMFVKTLLENFDVKLDIDNEQVLRNLPQGAFITVSNHPFGALDGIALIRIITEYRPEFKVIVNMVLNHISGMRPNFIAVDQSASADPAKRVVSMQGIREAIMQVRRGEPIGMFPAGAMSKIDYRSGILMDREWQPSMIRLIRQLKVPVIPIYFHGTNSFMFNLLGRTVWQLRTLRLPSEVFRKMHTTLKISVGDPISPATQALHDDESIEQFGQWLKDCTYALRLHDYNFATHGSDQKTDS